MKKPLIAIVISALVCLPTSVVSAQAYPVTVVQFAGGPDQIVEFIGAKAVVYGIDDKPLFRGARAFILGFTGNASGRVYAWDIARAKVRISPAQRPPVWLSCSELKAMPLACSTSLRIASDGALVVSGPKTGGPVRGTGPVEIDNGALGRLPDCPGDPRCP
jgi:hypothetical protein